MADLKSWMGTGAFFLCLGGWVCNNQANGADGVIQASPDKAKADRLLADAAAAAAKSPVADAKAITPAVAVAAADKAPAPADKVVAPSDKAVAPADKAPAPADKTADSVAAAPAAAPAASEPATDVNGADVAVSEDGTVQLHVRDLDIATVLRLLSLQSHRNIIASKDVKGTVTADLYKVTFYEALDAILNANSYGYVEKGNFIYVYSQRELDEIKKANRKAVNRVYRLHYMNAADASVLVKPLLSTSGQVALTPPMVAGIVETATDTGGNAFATDDTLVVNDYPENLVEIDKALKDLDVRPKQVLIESTILRASLTEDNALGIDLVTLSGVSFTGQSVAQDAGSTFNNFVNGNAPGTPGSPAKATVGTSFTKDLGIGDRGLSFGFLSSNINVFMRALEETTDTTIVANPKILALNKHRGEVFVGDHTGYKTTTTTQTTTQETVNFLDTGTKLIFRPNIGDDGYVRLEVHPEDSAGGLNSSQLPFTHSTEVTSNIMVKDGRTVVIGGLFREETTASRGQVPVLGSIPVLGIPFRRTNDDTKRNETIILLTPHVINDDTALYAESQKKQEDVARMMLGNRAGLMPWGRDRLAQCWFAKAEEAYGKGDKEKALMYTDWALNTNPRFIEAIKLREKLTGNMVKEADQSTIHQFVRDVLADDRNIAPDRGGSGHYAETVVVPTGPVPAATMPTTMPAPKH